MYYTRMFDHDLFDDLFDNAFSRVNASAYAGGDMMRTDIRENENGYLLAINLPGVHKEDVSASLKDGYLTVAASIHDGTEEEEKRMGKFLRRERAVGNFSRSFYVGDRLTEDNIHAKFENGVLLLSVPKENALPKQEEKKLISIE